MRLSIARLSRAPHVMRWRSLRTDAVTSTLRQLDAQMRARPLSWGVAISTVKAAGADTFAQTMIEQPSDRERRDWRLDRTRLAVFTTFGFFYMGFWNYALYARIYPWLAQMTTLQGSRSAALQLALDQCVHQPLFYFPCFYFTAACVNAVETGQSVIARDIFDVWKNNVLTDALACAGFWVPANGVCFFYVPIHWRVPYIAGVGFAWIVGLSSLRGRQTSDFK